MRPRSSFSHKKLGIICWTFTENQSQAWQGLRWAQDNEHEDGDTCHSHLGVHLGLHHGPHHCSSPSSGAFHFHFKCLPALIQKLGRDRLVRIQREPVHEPKIALQILGTTQWGHDGICKPISLVKCHLRWTSTLSRFKKVHAENFLASKHMKLYCFRRRSKSVILQLKGILNRNSKGVQSQTFSGII